LLLLRRLRGLGRIRFGVTLLLGLLVRLLVLNGFFNILVGSIVAVVGVSKGK
jgi:hypothetical protein